MKCTQCGQHVADGSPDAIAIAIGTDRGFGWDWIEDIPEQEAFRVGSFGEATMVAKSLVYGEEQGDDNRPIFLVFELDGILYRKDGHADSYGRRSWGGPVKPVTVKEKLMKSFVYVAEGEQL